MRTTWRATCLGLLVLAPLLLTACGEGDEGSATASAARSTSSTPASPASPSPGVYGQPEDPGAGEPTAVATDAAVPTKAVGAQVAPRLTYFGWVPEMNAVEAGGMVPGIVESGGTCTLTLSQGTTAVDASSESVDNVTSTSCPAMVIPGDRLSPGPWQAVLSYESATSRGVSEAVEVDVP